MKEGYISKRVFKTTVISKLIVPSKSAQLCTKLNGHFILYLFFLATYTKECVSFIMITNYNNTCSIHNCHYTDVKYFDVIFYNTPQ